jgi:hypothetical protein
MGLLDGQVIGTVRVIDHGSPAGRFNLVVVSEGYQLSELASFSDATDQFIEYLFSTPPFDGLKCAFNIYRIDVSSSESGADNPAACGGDGSVKATRFDASFCNFGIQRLLCVNSQAVIDVADAAVPEWHQILVIVNSAIYGGSGGHVAVTSTSGSWKQVALHEIGHAVFGLADEYPYWAGCSIDTNRNRYTGSEPGYPNVTVNTDRNTLKWKDLVDPVTPVPTTVNPDCTKCDQQANPFAVATTGLYEGARYYHCGIYRPEFGCMMKDLSGFCSVCRKRITDTMAVYLEKCYAPVFKPVPVLLAVFVIIFLLLAVIILSLLVLLFPELRCLMKKLLFIVRNCTRGNTDSCIAL